MPLNTSLVSLTLLSQCLRAKTKNLCLMSSKTECVIQFLKSRYLNLLPAKNNDNSFSCTIQYLRTVKNLRIWSQTVLFFFLFWLRHSASSYSNYEQYCKQNVLFPFHFTLLTQSCRLSKNLEKIKTGFLLQNRWKRTARNMAQAPSVGTLA